MAWLERRGDSYRVSFRFGGRLHAFTIGRVSTEEAETKAARVEYLLLRLRQRLIELPAGADIVDFLRHDGKPPAVEL